MSHIHSCEPHQAENGRVLACGVIACSVEYDQFQFGLTRASVGVCNPSVRVWTDVDEL